MVENQTDERTNKSAATPARRATRTAATRTTASAGGATKTKSACADWVAAEPTGGGLRGVYLSAAPPAAASVGGMHAHADHAPPRNSDAHPRARGEWPDS